jgi:polysaccharide export outer membrane protein
LFRTGKFELNMEIRPGDTLYVDKAPQFYIYGEVQRPGAYRVEKDLTLMQALSIGGGLTLRASRKDIQITRRDQQGKLTAFPASLSERILPDDTIYVKESLF